MADVLGLTLTGIWLAACIVFGVLYAKTARTVRRRVRELGLSHQAGLIGRDYVIMAWLGMSVAAYIGLTILVVLAWPTSLAAQVLSYTLLVAIPLLFLGHAVYLYRRVHVAA